ncbi:hypothetical protein C8R43DRAFT_887918 [Mycena crocata]|nr:hypothetical protein C8R43DRAFT_887918 [Mycena crocata]
MTPAPPLRAANWGAPAITSPPPCPPKAPQWFRENYEVVTAEQMGASFNALLTLLVAIEKGHNWKTSSRGLTALGRPKEVSAWMAAGRGLRGGVGAMGPKFPTLTSKTVEEYAEKYRLWWASSQPKWRVTAGTSVLLRDAGMRDNSPAKEWLPLRAPGQNGVFLAVLMLYWWRRELPADRAQDEWEDAVADVQFVFKGLNALQRREAGGNAGGTDLETDELRSESA